MLRFFDFTLPPINLWVMPPTHMTSPIDIHRANKFSNNHKQFENLFKQRTKN